MCDVCDKRAPTNNPPPPPPHTLPSIPSALLLFLHLCRLSRSPTPHEPARPLTNECVRARVCVFCCTSSRAAAKSFCCERSEPRLTSAPALWKRLCFLLSGLFPPLFPPPPVLPLIGQTGRPIRRLNTRLAGKSDSITACHRAWFFPRSARVFLMAAGKSKTSHTPLITACYQGRSRLLSDL